MLDGAAGCVTEGFGSEPQELKTPNWYFLLLNSLEGFDGSVGFVVASADGGGNEGWDADENGGVGEGWAFTSDVGAKSEVLVGTTEGSFAEARVGAAEDPLSGSAAGIEKDPAADVDATEDVKGSTTGPGPGPDTDWAPVFCRGTIEIDGDG